MQLWKIEFNGYKRLDKTSCNVDGKTIAFIGPNEAGKSSVLRGLAWLHGVTGDSPLPARDQNRRNPPDDSALVVRAHYRLDGGDIEALAQLGLDTDQLPSLENTTRFRLSRVKDGAIRTGIDTKLVRNPLPFTAARRVLERVVSALGTARDELVELGLNVPDDAVEAATSSLTLAGEAWDSDRVATLRSAAENLEVLVRDIEDQGVKRRAVTVVRVASEKAIPQLRSAVAAAEKPDPLRVMRSALLERVPMFLLFGDDDRELAETYHLGDDNLRNYPPPPLQNLLKVAGTSINDVWAAISGGDNATMRTLELRMNETLSSRLQPMWTQSKLTVHLALNQGGVLEVNIRELDSPDYTVTPIAERSDGLRTFLGLVCFLIAADLDVPPVLLVDEAERNLHYDAQADLIRVLTRDLRVHKVIYTTHSPGCLPMDLGTGIRVVSRNQQDPGTSTLSNNFWTDEQPGFSHLLFAMGAEAAAFSAFRRAVLAEGVSEMILLPTLLRNATDGSELDFQVAFGLSNASAPRAIGTVALITTFLVDGDASGREKKKQLERAGVPTGHIFQLPKNKAIEDLVDRATYLETVNEMLVEQGKAPIPASALDKGVTIAKAVDNYAKEHRGTGGGLGHKVIAARLASRGDELKLSASGKNFLASLRSQLESAFEKPFTLAPSSGD